MGIIIGELVVVAGFGWYCWGRKDRIEYLCEQLVLAQKQDNSECVGWGGECWGSFRVSTFKAQIEESGITRESETDGGFLASEGHPTEW